MSECDNEKTSDEFEKDLAELINRHSIENIVDMPDFILAEMLCRMIDAMGESIKKNLDWLAHGNERANRNIAGTRVDRTA